MSDRAGVRDELDSALDDCLTRLLSGEDSVASCLADYPEWAADLEPMLHTAHWLKQTSWPAIAPGVKSRQRNRLAAAFNSRFELVPARTTRFGLRPASRWVLLAAGILVVIAVAAILASAGESGWLDRPLPLQLARRGITATQEPPTGEAEQAGEQLDEIARHLARVRDFESGDRVEVQEIRAMLAHTGAALDSIERLPATVAWPLLEDLLDLIAGQEETLSGLVARASGPVKEEVRLALDDVKKEAARAQTIAAAIRPDAPAVMPQGGPSASPAATLTPEPGQDASQTEPQPPGQTKTPQPPGQTKTPQPPGHTKTPQPPGQVKTPDPPGHERTPGPPGQEKTPKPGVTKLPKPPKPAKPTGRP